MMNRRLSRDFYHLINNIETLSGGQASVCDCNADDISKFLIEITPSSGPYKGGKFKFKVGLFDIIYRVLTSLLFSKENGTRRLLI